MKEIHVVRGVTYLFLRSYLYADVGVELGMVMSCCFDVILPLLNVVLCWYGGGVVLVRCIVVVAHVLRCGGWRISGRGSLPVAD